MRIYRKIKGNMGMEKHLISGIKKRWCRGKRRRFGIRQGAAMLKLY
jgi:hypothetical protein